MFPTPLSTGKWTLPSFIGRIDHIRRWPGRFEVPARYKFADAEEAVDKSYSNQHQYNYGGERL